MTVYTEQTLKSINESYDYQHRLNSADLEMANRWVVFIEATRNDEAPQVGDIIEFTDKYGEFYRNTHINGVDENTLEICKRPDVPWVSIGQSGTLSTAGTCGGPWGDAPKNLKFVGKRNKLFKAWGHCGATANGAVHFQAKVNVWEYQEKDLEFTTRTHDKFYLDVREEAGQHEYKYLISKNASSHTAFKTYEEYQAWLKTFNGVERESTGFYTKLIWTFKQERSCIPLEEYLSVEGVIDTELCNGSVQECKRVTKGTTITTYLPYQNDMIKKDGVRYMNAYVGNL